MFIDASSTKLNSSFIFLDLSVRAVILVILNFIFFHKNSVYLSYRT